MKNQENLEKKATKIVWLIMSIVILIASTFLLTVDETNDVDSRYQQGMVGDDIIYKGEINDYFIDGDDEGDDEGVESKGGINELMDAVGQRESSNRYDVVNRFGYQGRYQIGKMVMKDLGIKGGKTFLQDHTLQDNAFKALLSINKYRLRNFITKYENRYINGIKITESGMLMASHLVGSKHVKRYLRSGGKKIKKDGNGVSLEHYIELFGGYELDIVAKRKVKLIKK